MKLKFLCCFLLLAFIVTAQEEDSTAYLQMPDKAYLHLDRNLYSPGDTVWAKAYVFHRSQHTLSDHSYSLHVQMLSQEGVEVANYKMLLVDGMGYGQFPIYDTMKPGLYQIIAHSGHMKNFGMQFFYKNTIEIGKKQNEACVKAFFDQDQYQVGDTAEVTFYAYDEFQTPLANKRFRYALKLGDKTLEKGGLRCSKEGTVTIALPITKGNKFSSPEIHLSYYKDYDQLVTQVDKVTIPMDSKRLLIDFFPESGDLVDGLNTRIAFMSKDVNGEIIDIEGTVFEDGKPLLNVATLTEGMGYFELKAFGKDYAFKVTKPAGIDSVYQLPTIIPSGYNMAYLMQDAKSLYLKVSHTFEEPQKMSLWVSQSDQLQKVYNLTIPESRMFSLPKVDLPLGLVTITLTNEHDVPVAERLVYLPVHSPEMKLTTDALKYNQRKKVKVNIALDNGGTTAHLSVAVVDSVLANSPWVECPSIKGYALLQSELQGHIPHLNSYLEDNKKADTKRNLLLMTHGWRRFSWFTNQQYLEALKVVNFDYIFGNVKKGKKLQPNSQMMALVMGDLSAYTEFKTDSLGKFRVLPKYEGRKGQKILFQAKNTKGKRNVNITLHNTDTLLYGKVKRTYKDDLKVLVRQTGRYFKQDDQQDDELPFLSYESKLLKELVVYGNLKDPSEEVPYWESLSAFSAGAMSGEQLESSYTFVDFVQQVTYRAQYNLTTDRIVVKSRGSGALMDSGTDDDAFGSDEDGANIYVNDMSWGKDASSLDFLSKEDIIEIIVLDPDDAYAAYGSEGKYGVILVRTNNLNLKKSQNSIDRNMAIFGRFIDSKEFYHPQFDTEEKSQQVVVDNRITLYWEPFVTTDENGEASFEFYTDDIRGAKQIVVQGIDDDGHLYYQTQEFEVEAVGY